MYCSPMREMTILQFVRSSYLSDCMKAHERASGCVLSRTIVSPNEREDACREEVRKKISSAKLFLIILDEQDRTEETE